MAKLIFNYAAMNSGKSMDLIRTIYNYEENGHRVLVMKPEVDTKGGNTIQTHSGLSRKVDILIPDHGDILPLLVGMLDDVKCIFIDEAQFLSTKQAKQLLIVSTMIDIPVICYGLRTNYKGELFEGSSSLMALADEINEFKGLCKCGEIARFNARRVNGKYVKTGDDVVIDGTEGIEYVSLCSRCFVSDVLRFDAEKTKKFVKKKQITIFKYSFLLTIFVLL